MGHVREVVEIEGELKPYIIIDLLVRVRAPSGGEIMLADIRRLIYGLKDDLGFKLEKVTMDGFESTDTKQQLRRKRIHSDILSVDRDLLPYYDLREAIYENRIEFPPYMVRYNPGDTHLTEVAVKELQELIDEGKKIDHPPDGSKDVADAIAGVTTTLMGDRRYHKKVIRIDTIRQQKQAVGQNNPPFGGNHPAFVGVPNPSMPIPPPVPRRDD